MCLKLKSVEDYLKSLTGRADLAVLERLLKEAQFTYEDVKAKCSFTSDHYCRNLIASGPWFDMLLLCWKPGQESSIHDHVGSSCAFRIVKGTSTEEIYRKNGKNRGEISLVDPIGTMTYQVGELCLAQDEAIHKILNRSVTEDLVTLHIYSPPLHMNYYETENGTAGYQPPECAQKHAPRL